VTVSRLWKLLKTAMMAWVDDYASSMGAALAYYTLFSLAPLLLLVIAVAGLVFGADAARGHIVSQLSGLIGEEGAVAIQGLLKSASHPGQSVVASLISGVTLIIGATSIFGELQSDLDRIWRAPAATTSGIWGLLRTRLLSLGLVVSIGFLLLVSLVVSAMLSALGTWWASWFGGWAIVLQVVNQVVSFGITTLLFALMYRILPRVSIGWNDVWIGSVATALFFTLGKFVIGLYLGRAGVTSGFGAAGSIVVLLVWVYYSSQLFLLGAEFTSVYAHHHGSRATRDAARNGLSKRRPIDSAGSKAGCGKSDLQLQVPTRSSVMTSSVKRRCACSLVSSGRLREQRAHPHQIEGRRGEDEGPVDARAAAVPQLAQQADGLHPAKALLDQLPFLLTDRVARMTRRPRIDRTAAGSRDTGRHAG
jgi:membrane protein